MFKYPGTITEQTHSAKQFYQIPVFFIYFQFPRVCTSFSVLILEPWLIACDIFYPIAALIHVFALLVSILGFCTDIGNYTAAIPSFIQWSIAISTLLQLITVSIYGGKGIGDYSLQEPDFSLIIAAIATGLSAICSLLFILETECSSKKRVKKGYPIKEYTLTID
jgi:hypothetical protein